MLPRHGARDDLFLDPAKVREAEAVVENLMRVGHSLSLFPQAKRRASLAMSP